MQNRPNNQFTFTIWCFSRCSLPGKMCALLAWQASELRECVTRKVPPQASRTDATFLTTLRQISTLRLFLSSFLFFMLCLSVSDSSISLDLWFASISKSKQITSYAKKNARLILPQKSCFSSSLWLFWSKLN